MWGDVEKMLMEHLSGVTVSDLARKQTEMSRPRAEPVTLAFR
jgi:hypothetical protein